MFAAAMVCSTTGTRSVQSCRFFSGAKVHDRRAGGRDVDIVTRNKGRQTRLIATPASRFPKPARPTETAPVGAARTNPARALQSCCRPHTVLVHHPHMLTRPASLVGLGMGVVTLVGALVMFWRQ